MLFASGDISAEYDHMQYSTLGLDTGLDDRDTFLRSKESFVLFCFVLQRRFLSYLPL